MRDAIRSEQFGPPLQLVAVRGANVPHRRPNYRQIYSAHRAQGGGAIQDILPHMTNAGEWLVGSITRLTADAAHLALQGVEVEDTVHLLARHGDVLASYSLNQHQMPGEFAISVNCQNGTARVEFHNNRWLYMLEADGRWCEEQSAVRDQDDWFLRQSHVFLDGLAGKADPLCTLEEAVQTLRVTLAALASVERDGAWREVATPVPG